MNLGESASPKLTSDDELTHRFASGNPSPWRVRRLWTYRLVSLFLGPLVFLGLAESALRMAGVGYATSFFLVRKATTQGATATLTDNPEFGRRFFPPSLVRNSLSIACPTPKPQGTYRIFVLGESAAMGIPDPSVSFARILEVMLRDRFPEVSFEFINTSMVAINSHVVLEIARECARYQPDLFIVLMGNNEVVGPFGAAGVIGPYAPRLRLIRASLWAQGTRIGQLMSQTLQATGAARSPRFWDGLAMFEKSRVAADDPRLRATYAHFQENFKEICLAGTKAGAAVIACTVPVNLADCPPFASAHAAGLTPKSLAAWEQLYRDGVEHQAAGEFAAALHLYDDATKLDPAYAELAFRRARCLARLGRPDEVAPSDALARDLDLLRFRADSTLNETVRKVVANATGPIQLVDAEREFAAYSPDGSPDGTLFHEHVHMTFSGNYLLARVVFRKAATLIARPGVAGPVADPLTEAACADRLAYTRRERARNEIRIHEMLQNPPFTAQLDSAEREARWQATADQRQDDLGPQALATAVDVCRAAVQTNPSDWMLRAHYAYLLTELGAPTQAAAEYETLLKQRPYTVLALDKLATLQLKARRFDDATATFETALKITPGDSEAAYGLAEVLAARGNIREAIVAYEAQVAKEPDRVEALRRLAGFLDHLGRTQQARTHLEEAIRLDPHDPFTHVDLSNALAKAGDLAGAIAHSEAALRIRPHWPALADHLAQLRKTDRAGTTEPASPQDYSNAAGPTNRP